ncbi:conserved hypothetical protein [Planktothrix serta PCC 8927]|uniref:Uncharacterized protein n=1 Tax=Planktothrix serta PCC 8927 TaxID=671068 RepID=A0A7Z9E3N7_9CYAN|nr:hypothetical protein [Planktothrix serta]VXD23493.1 conserved hypothetical protein [Planktothrix serta PCC 8927]
MNVQKDQIQALIAEIDDVLSQPNLRLPWVVFGETVTRSRQVLERVRKYLVVLQQQVDEGALLSPMETNQPSSPGMREPLWQAIRREMIYLRSHLTQPLQDEVDRLRTEQRNLVQEIQQLEARKAQTLAQIQPSPSYQQQLSREFLQEFMTRLQDSLIHNVTETLNHIETRFLDSVLLTESNSLPALAAEPVDRPRTSLASLTPAQRLEQMRQLQTQSDHLLMTLDSSLSVIFESLQRNLQTYSDSLSQSLERMHGLGQQGEVMFTTLVNQLAQQVGQETSSYLQSSLQLTESEPPANTIAPPAPTESDFPSVAPSEDLPLTFEELLPYAGAELPRQPARPVNLSDSKENKPQRPKTTDQPQVQFESVQKLSSLPSQDELDLMPEEPAFSLDLDQSGLEQSRSEDDLDLEALFNMAEEEEPPVASVAKLPEIDLFGEDVASVEEEESSVASVVEPAEIDFFDEDAAFVEGYDEDEVSEDVETLLLDEETQTDDAGSDWDQDQSQVSLDTEDLFEDTAATAIQPLEPEDISPEALDESPLNALDLFNESDPEVLIESELPLTTEFIESASLESEDLFPEEAESVSLVMEQLTASPAASAPNPFEETLADLSDIFEEPTFEDASPVVSSVVSAKTQQMLTGVSTPVESSSPENRTARLETDEYIQASPDENLLPIELDEDSDQVDSRLLIDRNTLEYLEVDLFNLEQPETNSTPKRSPEKLTISPPQPIPQKPRVEAVPPKVSPPEELITFEDLFRDIGMEPRSAQSVPSLAIESVNKPSVEAQNLVSLQSFSDLTLDDVFNSLNLAEEQPLHWETEGEENSLSLEALSQEFHQ